MILEAKNLRKTYGQGTPVLKGVSFELAHGSWIALMGPSGCGKSTLLNLVAGIDQVDTLKESTGNGPTLLFHPDASQPAVDLLTLPEHALTRLRSKHIGFVFQFFNLLTTLTVWENVALPLQLTQPKLGPKALNEQILPLLEAVGLSHRVNVYPATLSGGEMQRVAIARALVHQPKLLLADEPTGNLDSETGVQILDLLQTLQSQLGQSIIMATHSAEAAAYADHTLTMRDGQILG